MRMAKEFLADIAGGDARAALNAIELGVLSTERQADGKIHIDLDGIGVHPEARRAV